MTFIKVIVLDKVDPLGHSSSMQRDYFAAQRGDPRSVPIMIKNCKCRSTYKNRQTRSAGSKIYATNQPAAKCPTSKNKMGTYFTANRVGI